MTRLLSVHSSVECQRYLRLTFTLGGNYGSTVGPDIGDLPHPDHPDWCRRWSPAGWRYADCGQTAPSARYSTCTNSTRPGQYPGIPGSGSDAANAIDHRGGPALYYRINTLVQTLSMNGGLAGSPCGNFPPRGRGRLCCPRRLASSRRQRRRRGRSPRLARPDTICRRSQAERPPAIDGAREHIAACPETVPAETRNALHSACKIAGIELLILDAPELLTSGRATTMWSCSSARSSATSGDQSGRS